MKEFSGCKLGSNASHFLFQYPDFRNITVEQRQATSQRLKACGNCLGENHSSRNCTSKQSCQTCGRRRHSLLHQPNVPQQLQYLQPSTTSSPPVNTVQSNHVSETDPVCNTATSSVTVILGTCIVTIEHQGKLQKARALIDNGSGLSFIISKLTNTLGLKKIAEPTSIVAFQQTSMLVSMFNLKFTLRVPNGSVTTLMSMGVLVVDTITGDLPAGVLPLV